VCSVVTVNVNTVITKIVEWYLYVHIYKFVVYLYVHTILDLSYTCVSYTCVFIHIFSYLVPPGVGSDELNESHTK
jgi:hypothetical protein